MQGEGHRHREEARMSEIQGFEAAVRRGVVYVRYVGSEA